MRPGTKGNTQAHEDADRKGAWNLTLLLALGALVSLATAAPLAQASNAPCGFGLPDANAIQQPELPPGTFTLTSNATDVGWQVTATTTPTDLSDLSGHEDPERLWYTSTDLSQGNYESGPTGENASHGNATSPPVLVPAIASSPTLYFSNRYEVEGGDASTHDLMLVQSSTNNGASWQTLCTLNPTSAARGTMDQTTCSNDNNPATPTFPCPTDPTGTMTTPLWESRTIPLPTSVIGNSLQIRFNFDTVDGQRNSGLGWMVTDARVGFTLPPPTVQVPTPTVTFPTPPTSGGGGVQGAPTLDQYGMGVMLTALAIMGTVLAKRRGGKQQ
jgi:hypothetical protein